MSVHVGYADLAGRADANSLEPKSTDLGSRSFAPLHARGYIDMSGHDGVAFVVARGVVGCSLIAWSLPYGLVGYSRLITIVKSSFLLIGDSLVCPSTWVTLI